MGVEHSERKPDKKSRHHLRRSIFELGTTTSLTVGGIIVNNTAPDGTVRQVALGVAGAAFLCIGAALARAGK